MSVIAIKNLLAFIVPLLEVIVPNKLTDNNNVDNYNNIN